MLKFNSGELPTIKNNQSNRAKKLKLFNHYLNHKLDSNKSVLEHIIYSFNKQYKPEIYYFKSTTNSKVTDDSLRDIRSIAYLAVWEATDKYLWGISKKSKIKYEENFDFCVFASEQVKYKLRTHLRLLNTNRICGKLPDSDSIRIIYSKLPKLKLNNKNLSEKNYHDIATENKLNLDDIKLVDKFITTKTESGDASIIDEDKEEIGNKWTQLEFEDNNLIKSNNEISEIIEKKIIAQNFNTLRIKFLSNLNTRDKEILNNTIFEEFNTSKKLSLKQLAIKFGISSERVRQISERKILDFKKILIENKKKLGKE